MSKKFEISVYEYDDACIYLKNIFEQIKSCRPSYSIRAWSKQLNAKNPTSLTRILTGNRRVPKDLLPNISNSLELDSCETAYLELLALGKGRISAQSLETLKEALCKLKVEPSIIKPESETK